MKKAVIFFLLSLPLRLIAQQTSVYTPYAAAAIQVDKNTKKTNSPLPFDQSFVLQYSLDSATQEKLFNVFIFQVKIANGVRDILVPSSGRPVTPLMFTWDTLKKNTVTIYMKPLKPNTLMDIAIVRKLNSTEIDTLMVRNEELYAYNHSHFVNDFNTTGIRYRAFMTTLTQKPYSSDPGFIKYSFSQYNTYFADSLLAYYRKVKEHDFTKYNSNPLPSIDTSYIKTLDLALIAHKIPDDDLLPISGISQEGLLKNLFDGTADITSKYPAGSLADDDDYDTRQENLASALAYVKKLIALLERTKLSIPISDNFYKAVLLYRHALDEDQKLVATNYLIIKTKLKNNRYLNSNEWLLTENDFNDLSLLSKNIIIPDIGIATFALQGHEKWQFFPRPFVGVNIYFRPVNKTIKESYFPKGDYDPWRLLSLQLGLTYGKLSGNEFSNLFNDFNLMAGPSYRFARFFRVGAGTVLTQQTDANPLISQTHTHFGYYIAFSFDTDIFSSGSSVTTRILK